MKRSEEWPNYRLKEDGTLIYLKSRFKDNRVKSFVVAVKDPEGNHTRVSLELEDFKKMFTIPTDEPDDSMKKKSEDNSNEKWRNVNDWVEVSTEGRIRFEGNIRKPVKNSNGHPFYLCNRHIDGGIESYMVTMWKEVIKFKYPDYKASKVIFVDGDKGNIKLENLEDARLTRHLLKSKEDNDVAEAFIKIKKVEFDAMKSFNHHINESTKQIIKDLKKENGTLRKIIEANRLEKNVC